MFGWLRARRERRRKRAIQAQVFAEIEATAPARMAELRRSLEAQVSRDRPLAPPEAPAHASSTVQLPRSPGDRG
jgi:hypothetical protein